jgi:hypothetical protein
MARVAAEPNEVRTAFGLQSPVEFSEDDATRALQLRHHLDELVRRSLAHSVRQLARDAPDRLLFHVLGGARKKHGRGARRASAPGAFMRRAVPWLATG